MEDVFLQNSEVSVKTGDDHKRVIPDLWRNHSAVEAMHNNRVSAVAPGPLLNSRLKMIDMLHPGGGF